MMKQINAEDVGGCICNLPDKSEVEISSGSYISTYLTRDDSDYGYAVYAVAEDNTDFAKINFCPFCGRKLQ